LNGFPPLQHTRLSYWGPKTSETQKALDAEIDAILLGRKNVEQAMKDATTAIDDILGG